MLELEHAYVEQRRRPAHLYFYQGAGGRAHFCFVLFLFVFFLIVVMFVSLFVDLNICYVE